MLPLPAIKEYWLGIDLETTGLNEYEDEIIEIGLVLYAPEDKTIVEMESFLVQRGILGGKAIPDEIEALTGISELMRNAHGESVDQAAARLHLYLDRAHKVVAHNRDFETRFLGERLSIWIEDARWIDTRYDLPYEPESKGNGSLSEICMSHGIFNPCPHRALPDALAMMQLLAKYPYYDVAMLAKEPKIHIIALVSYDERDKAKALGYHWDGLTKTWGKQVKASKVGLEEAKANQAGFKISIQALEQAA